jgi:hypothetical protein
LEKIVLGYILVDFLQTHLVTLRKEQKKKVKLTRLGEISPFGEKMPKLISVRAKF